MKYRTRHYFNNILYTPWPFSISFSLFNIIIVSVLFSNKYGLHLYQSIEVINLYFILSFSIFIDSIFCWCKEVRYESTSGKYTKKIRTALFYGFLLFLLSEAVLFGCLFWGFFDRLFHLSFNTGFASVPTTNEFIRWYREPLYATLVLVTSGWTCNLSYYYFNKTNNIIDSRKNAYLNSVMTLCLGFYFLYIQYSEYCHLSFTISDTIYASIFYTLTGFHGLHVLIGAIFLATQYYIKFWYINHRTSSLTMAVLYWHFVDIIWLFLWFFVYYFNNFFNGFAFLF